MNLYLVISEEMVDYGPTRYMDAPEPPEWYRICELVVARNHSQARWLAWQTDRNSFENYMPAMPKFTCQIKERDYDDGPARVLPYEDSHHMPYWDSKAAPHIGLEADIVEEVPA